MTKHNNKDKPIDAEIVTQQVPTSTALIPASHVAVSLARDPQKILAEAKLAADALMAVIDAKPEKKKVKMNGERYLVFEDWQTVGRFFNLVPRVKEDRLIQIQMGPNAVTGYEAVAEAVDVITGSVISSATAMCLNDEDKWSSKNKYVWMYVCRDGSLSEEDPGYQNIVWEDTGIPKNDGSGKNKNRPKKQRELVGTVAVPLFQLRSMAQTRACAKAMRNALAWVVVLAGFAPTPAEELNDDGPPDSTYDDKPEQQGPVDRHVEPEQPLRRKGTTAKKAAASKTPPPAPRKPPVDQAPDYGYDAHANVPLPSVNSRTAPPPAPPPPPPAAAAPPRGDGKRLTDAQQRRLWAIARTNGWTNEQVHKLMVTEVKVEHTADIPSGRNGYDRLVNDFLSKHPKEAGYV